MCRFRLSLDEKVLEIRSAPVRHEGSGRKYFRHAFRLGQDPRVVGVPGVEVGHLRVESGYKDNSVGFRGCRGLGEDLLPRFFQNSFKNRFDKGGSVTAGEEVRKKVSHPVFQILLKRANAQQA